MTQEELRQLLTASGWTCKTAREEVVLQVCYFCGNDRWNLELNASVGVYHCWVCKKGGRLSEVLRMITGDDFHIPVHKKAPRTKQQIEQATMFQSLPVGRVPSACLYLARRGIPPDVADRYGVVVCTEKDHQLEGRLTFPLKEFWTDALVGWSGRSYTFQHPKYISTMLQKVITGWRNRDDDPVVVVEGPFDGLAVHEAGYQAAVLSGVGTGGVVDWAARLSFRVPVVIMLDPEAHEQAKQLYWKIQPVLGARVTLVDYRRQEKDPAELGPEGIRPLVDDALRGRGHTN